MLSDAVTRPGLVNKGSCIDNVVTNFHTSKYNSDVLNVEFSDHHAILFCLEVGLNHKVKPKDPISYNTFRVTSHDNLATFNNCLNKINWLNVYCVKNTDKMFHTFFELYMWAVNLGIPLKKVCNNQQLNKSSVNQWYTTKLFNLKV